MSWSCEKKSLTSVKLLLCVVFAFFAVSACGDSVEADEDVATTQEESSSSVKSLSLKAKSSSSSAKSSSSSKLEYPDSFKPQDKEYPYAGIPRIVIET
jgi:outer membrane lipoprotein-sorting protein